MNLAKQIRKYREEAKLTQEELAEKMYISRQTVSNWENERSYPDIHNVLLLSAIFDVSLDELVKGDLEMMKTELQRDKVRKLGVVMNIFLFIPLALTGPVTRFFGFFGAAGLVLMYFVALIAALKMEKIKKESNIQTYAEWVAFLEERDVKERELQKSKRNEVIAVLMFSILALVVVFASIGITALVVGRLE